MPGYGYANVSKNTRDQLANLIESYISNRENLIKVYVLIDCKVGIKSSDIDIIDLITSSNIKFSYRGSDLDNNLIFISATFRGKKDNKSNIKKKPRNRR